MLHPMEVYQIMKEESGKVKMKGPIQVWFEVSLPEVGSSVEEITIFTLWKVPDRDDTDRMTEVMSRKSYLCRWDDADCLRHTIRLELENMCRFVYRHEFEENFYVEGVRKYDPHSVKAIPNRVPVL